MFYSTCMKETIRVLREKHNYSQATVAKYLNISRQMYIKYESGEAEPPVKVVVGLSRLYKVDYAQIIDNTETQNKTASYNNNCTEKKSEGLYVASPSVAYGSSKSSFLNQSANNNFELAKTLIPKLSIFEQLQMLSLLAYSIGKNGANQITNSAETVPQNNYSKSNTLSEKDKDDLFQKFSGFLKDSKVEDPKDAKLEHLYKKYDIE